MADANAFSADALQIVRQLDPVLEQACADMIRKSVDQATDVFARVLKQAISDAMVVVIRWCQKPLSGEPDEWYKPHNPIARISSALGVAEQMVRKQHHDCGANRVYNLGSLVLTAAALAPIFMLCHNLTHYMMQRVQPFIVQYWVDDYDRGDWIIKHPNIITEFQVIIKDVCAKIAVVRADLVSRGVLPKFETAASQ